MDFHILKGQVNVGFIVSVILLSFVLVTVTTHILDLTPSFKEVSERANLEAKAIDINELLLNDPGVPANWSSSPLRFGLAYYDEKKQDVVRGKLDIEKINYVNSITYNKVKNNLNIGNETDFRLVIKNTTTILLDIYNLPPSKARNVVSIKRIMVIENKVVNVTLTVW